MKMVYKIFALTLMTSSAYAADLYSQYSTPDSIGCTGPHKNVCTDTTRPDDIVVQYKDAYGKVTMQQEPSFEIVTCIGISDKCIDNDRNYRGKSITGRDVKYVVFKDFYIYPGGDGKDWAYKNGTLSAYKVAFKDYIKYGGTLINFLKFKSDDKNIRSSTYWSILNS